jgi:cell pole-organizing protein PopZ
VSNQTNNNDENNDKLEDILSSIRGIIENHNPISDESNYIEGEEEGAVLELTKVADSSSADGAEILLSSDVQHQAEVEFKRFAESVAQNEVEEVKTDSMDDKVNKIMRPLIKDWLDNNLPRIVERVVSEEIKRIVPKS